MMIPSSRPSPRLIPLFGVLIGALTTTSHAQSAGSVNFEIVSPERVTDLSGWPSFSELYTLPTESTSGSEPTDYWILRNVRSYAFALDGGTAPDKDEDEEEEEEGDNEDGTPGEGDDELPEEAEEAYDYRHIARYEAMNSGSRRISERGAVAWRLASGESTSASGAGTIGFIRAPQRPGQLQAQPVTGHFTGAAGEIAWETKSTRRTSLLTLTNAAYDPGAEFENYITLSHGTSGVTVGSFQFPVPGSSPVRFWQFTSTVPLENGASTFVDVIQRADAVTAEDIPDSQVDSDPQGFWERVYFIVLRDDRDSDRDGIPDYADLTESLPLQPWYSDYDWGNNWFYVSWMDTAIYSDREVSLLWDYSLKLGWNYVPLSSDRRNFWTYVDSGGFGWMYTSESWYPAFYRDSDGVYLYQTGADNGIAEFYNYSTGERETVQFY